MENDYVFGLSHPISTPRVLKKRYNRAFQITKSNVHHFNWYERLRNVLKQINLMMKKKKKKSESSLYRTMLLMLLSLQQLTD